MDLENFIYLPRSDVACGVSLLFFGKIFYYTTTHTHLYESKTSTLNDFVESDLLKRKWPIQKRVIFTIHLYVNGN